MAIASNTAWYIANFRLRLATTLRARGYKVVAIAPYDGHAERIETAGIRFVPLPMDNMGTNPLADLSYLWRLASLLRRERIDLLLGYTVKPNVYGGIASRLLGIQSVHNIAGLGTAFIRQGWLTRLVEGLYRIGLGGAAKVFFQNDDDLTHFLDRRLIARDLAERIPGSGVDLEWFAPMQRSDHEGAPFRFLLSARLVRDKGVGEYVNAARLLRARRRHGERPVEFQLLGFLDVENRTAIPRAEVDAWEREGVVRYLGTVTDVRPVIAQADCVVLPSYREGVPRALLEAASMGKPIITTDAVGCRDVVEHGVNGLLCRLRDPEDLALQMEKMLAMSGEERFAMGRAGRVKMEREFDEAIVIARYLRTIEESLQGRGADSDRKPATDKSGAPGQLGGTPVGAPTGRELPNEATAGDH